MVLGSASFFCLHLSDGCWAIKDSLLPNAISRSVGKDDQMSIHGMQGARVLNQPALRPEQLGLGVNSRVGAVIPLGAENASLQFM